MRQLSAFALELYRACREMAVDRYQSWALDQLKLRVPFDAALWASGHMEQSGAVIHNVHLANRPFSMLGDYEGIKHEDRFAFENATNVGRACAWNALTTRTDLSPKMLAYLETWRIEHALACHVVDPPTGLLTTISLWREAHSAPFDEETRRLYEVALPHLIETFAINRITHMIRATQPRNAALYASAMADRLGTLHIAPDDFQRRLLAEWPGWHGHRLPEEILRLVQDDTGARFVGKRVFFRSLRIGDAYLLQARDKRAADKLTVRETEIARLSSSGLTYSEVAKHLAISPATVRNHLSKVFEKLGAHKQAEIVPLLSDIE